MIEIIFRGYQEFGIIKGFMFRNREKKYLKTSGVNFKRIEALFALFPAITSVFRIVPGIY